MTQLGGERTEELNTIIECLYTQLKSHRYSYKDANSLVTGKDFLDKIWKISLSVPLGVAVVTEEMSNNTISNIFYELGLLTALGKETIVIKTSKFKRMI